MTGITFPSASPVRGVLRSSLEVDALTEEGARRQIEDMAVRALQDAGQLDAGGRPTLLEGFLTPHMGASPDMPGERVPVGKLNIIELVHAEDWPEQLLLTRVTRQKALCSIEERTS